MIVLLKDKSPCYKCKYRWFPRNMQKFLGVPMCLFYHDTEKHREGNDDYCGSFEEGNRQESWQDKNIVNKGWCNE